MIDQIISYENGELDESQAAELFQYFLDTGVIYTLPGSYQRTAQGLLKAGLITRSHVKKVRRRTIKRAKKAPRTWKLLSGRTGKANH